ncbi:MAG: TetR/AcrR family transcriptional regulator [Acidimicrobiia bacterium]
MAGPRLRADQRRRQLLDIARTVFAERGFSNTSMDDVATAAGVTKPVLYQHFPNKRALFVTLLDDVGLQLLTELGAATTLATNPREQVEAGFLAYFRYVRRDRAAFRLLFGASVRNDPEFSTVAERTIADASAAISALIVVEGSEEQRLVLAHALIGVAEAVARYALLDDDPRDDPETLAQWVAQLAWAGLRGVTPIAEAEQAEADWRRKLLGL